VVDLGFVAPDHLVAIIVEARRAQVGKIDGLIRDVIPEDLQVVAVVEDVRLQCEEMLAHHGLASRPQLHRYPNGRFILRELEVLSMTRENIEETMVRRLAEATQAARPLTDRVQRYWMLIPQSGHNMMRQSVVRQRLRSCKAAVLKATGVSEAAAPLRELFLHGVALGRELRTQLEVTEWTDSPPPLPTGLEVERAVEALTNLTALHLLSRGRGGLLEKVGDILGSAFALQEVGDLFQAGLYVGYTGEAQDDEIQYYGI